MGFLVHITITFFFSRFYILSFILLLSYYLVKVYIAVWPDFICLINMNLESLSFHSFCYII